MNSERELSPPLEPLSSSSDNPPPEQFEQRATDLVGRVVGGRYRVLSLLGVGGMATVYQAEHIHVRRPVALKIMHRELALQPEVVARFEREAIAAGRIDDPHVVGAMDFGRLEDGSFYLVLEHVQGTDLGQLLTRGPLPPARALAIARQIAVALEAAHAAGVVHRDLKPENVMLLERPEEPDFVKVLDFGIAKITLEQQRDSALPGGALTQVGSVFGTPEYMAPEQAAGLPVDHRADLYTLGVILYEMLVGKPPFVGDDVGEVLRMQLESEPPPLPSSVPAPLGDLVLRQLEKDPARRCQSATELREELDRVWAELGLLGAGRQTELLHDSGPAVEPERLEVESKPRTHWMPLGSGLRLPRRSLLWAASALLLLVAGGAFVTSFRNGRKAGPVASGPMSSLAPGSATPARLRANAVDPTLSHLLAQGSLGDEGALRALEARPAESRSAAEWLALGRGRMELGRALAALEAYDQALQADPSLASDPTLLRHLRQAATDEASSEAAFRIATRRLGSTGADLVYDVWVATRARTAVTQRARQLVYHPELRARASPALGVVLDLREAKSCEEFQRLLPRVILHGDTRALRVLQPLTRKQGCGPKQKDDCYPCLRGDDSLEKAISAVRVRAEPRFW